MVVTDSRQAAERYKIETDSYIHAKGYKIKTIVAYSGYITYAEYSLEKATEATLNPGLGADLALGVQASRQSADAGGGEVPDRIRPAAAVRDVRRQETA